MLQQLSTYGDGARLEVGDLWKAALVSRTGGGSVGRDGFSPLDLQDLATRAGGSAGLPDKGSNASRVKAVLWVMGFILG